MPAQVGQHGGRPSSRCAFVKNQLSMMEFYLIKTKQVGLSIGEDSFYFLLIRGEWPKPFRLLLTIPALLRKLALGVFKRVF